MIPYFVFKSNYINLLNSDDVCVINPKFRLIFFQVYYQCIVYTEKVMECINENFVQKAIKII